MKEDKSKTVMENELLEFLFSQGVPTKSLPRLTEVPKCHLMPIMEGHKKENKTELFYICVCNSGHDVWCQNIEWTYSGWNIRVKGTETIFFKGEWEFNISQIPVFQDTLFVVSKRTKVSECAQIRTDILCFSQNRKKLLRKTKKIETNRKRNH